MALFFVEIYCHYPPSFVSEARAILDTDKIERLMRRVRDVVIPLIGAIVSIGDVYEKRISEIMCCASLAHHGLLGSVVTMRLLAIDLSPVPAQHLASLVSCVTRNLNIWNISGCDLFLLLSSLKCKDLMIARQRLGRQETRALVQAMESRLEIVTLGDQVTLDIEALAEYNGHGVCRRVELEGDTVDRYGEELKTWAWRGKWRVDKVMPFHKVMQFFKT